MLFNLCILLTTVSLLLYNVMLRTLNLKVPILKYYKRVFCIYLNKYKVKLPIIWRSLSLYLSKKLLINYLLKKNIIIRTVLGQNIEFYHNSL